MSTISSRTPEGDPIRCPVCGHLFPALPSKPLMDTTYPNCGCLLMVEHEDQWFNVIAIVGSVTAHRGHADEIPHETNLEHGDEPDLSLVPGDFVRITRGTFAGFDAQIGSIDTPTQTAVVKISIFGRVTPVELRLSDLVRQP